MADSWLVQLHSSSIAQKAQPGTPGRRRSDPAPSDEAGSWVMLSQDGQIVKLPHERILLAVQARVGFEMASTRNSQAATESSFSVRSDSGSAYITNKRVIYLPSKLTEAFKSFFAPILHFDDTDIGSTGLFSLGPWCWFGEVRPVRGGGIPASITRVEVKLIFKEGGHSEFKSKFDLIRERLLHARDLERETGQRIIVDDEELPPYVAVRPPTADEQGVPPPASPPVAGLGAAPGGGACDPPPTEPPPDYAQAQAQAVNMRLEERMREDAERS